MKRTYRYCLYLCMLLSSCSQEGKAPSPDAALLLDIHSVLADMRAISDGVDAPENLTLQDRERAQALAERLQDMVNGREVDLFRHRMKSVLETPLDPTILQKVQDLTPVDTWRQVIDHSKPDPMIMILTMHPIDAARLTGSFSFPPHAKGPAYDRVVSLSETNCTVALQRDNYLQIVTLEKRHHCWNALSGTVYRIKEMTQPEN